MSSNSIDYSLLEREELNLTSLGSRAQWDRYVSGFNLTDRVRKVFTAAPSAAKHWLIFPEYQFENNESPSDGTVFTDAALREDDYILSYFSRFPIGADEKVCFDITGFMRPHLLFLIRLLHHWEVKEFDCVYSEPNVYEKADGTKFSGGGIREVRQVAGFEGNHSIETENDLLIVGCGYDHALIKKIAEDKKKARKVQLFPFPSLRPHMYQESRLRTHQAADAFGGNMEDANFAPAHDPFGTASVLSGIKARLLKDTENLYLSPLATKPQVAGFALFYVTECLGTATSVIFPFTSEYSKKTSDGVSQIWRYHFEF